MSSYKNIRVAVTGSTGNIGKPLVERLHADQAIVTEVSRSYGDIRYKSLWEKVIAENEIIFHLAGNTSIYAAEADPELSLMTTVLPVTLIHQISKQMNLRPRILFASTATVYGIQKNSIFTELSPVKPSSQYDLHKSMAEIELALSTEQSILNATSLRLSNVYGASAGISSSQDRGIINQISQRVLKGEGINVYGEGKELRDYIYITDVVDAFYQCGLSQETINRILNVSSGVGTSINDAFRTVASRGELLSGKKVSVNHVPWPQTAHPIEFRNHIIDSSVLQSLTTWKPKVSFEAGIDLTLAYFYKGSK